MTRAALACGACAVVVGLGAPANGAAPDRVGTIAFEAADGLYLIDAGGGMPRKIPGTQPGDGDPAWSPNGRRLAFDRLQVGGDNRDIYVMNVDGSGVRRLTTAPSDDGWPEWAPDGRTLAFVSDRDGRRSVYAIKVRTAAARRVALWGQFPDWTSDNRIIFTGTTRGGERGQILTIRPYGADRRPLPTQPGDALAVNVSHDGARLVVTTLDIDIHTAAIDGSGSTPVLTGEEDFNDPDWSPNDGWIVYDFPAAGDLRSEIYVVRAEGGRGTRLTKLGYACCAEWSLTAPTR